MICIYDKQTSKDNFETDGPEILSEAISCYITEELNERSQIQFEFVS